MEYDEIDQDEITKEIFYAEQALCDDPATHHWLEYLLLLQDNRVDQARHYYEDVILPNQLDIEPAV